jgi:hypothetical protein
MKKFLVLASLAIFSTAIIGCHASGDVDSSDNTNSSTYKKTTYKNDGGTKTTTETKKETTY